MPSRTRAFLFSDLRGYSSYTERHGDRAARELLARYRRVVREVIDTFHGAEIRTEGDSFYVVFDSVSDALQAGLGILASLDAEAKADAADRIPVGIGVHAGESEDSEEGIVSGAVNVAARLCARAEPGELLVSDTVRALTRTHIPMQFVPRGRRRLKGIADPVMVYRVLAATEGGSDGGRPRVADSGHWLRVAGAAVVVTVAVLAIAILGGTLMREGIASDDPSAPARPSLAASESESAAPSPSVDATAEAANAFPNVAEEDLLTRLPPGMAPEDCVRADPDEVPTKPKFHDPGLEPLAVAAALRCPIRPGLDVFFYASGPCNLVSACGSDAQATVFSYASRREVARGECSGEAEALDEWHFGRATGWVLCGPDMLWTYDRSNLLGRATSAVAGVAFEWWRDNARFPAE